METINLINDFVWSYVVTIVLVGAALYFTFRTKGIQFRFIGDAIRVILGRDEDTHESLYPSGKKIGSFRAFAASLASRVGTGNLAGVASAIFIGGPGAVFWMWLMAFFGAATAFFEATLAQLYKKRGADAFYGGPAYYMETGLGKKWMGALFSILMILSFGMAQNVVQSQTIISSLSDSFALDPVAVAIALAALLFVIVVGGVMRISLIVSYIVPFMAIGYLIIAIVVICMNLSAVPGVLALIVKSAFGIRQVGGGMIGAAILQGVKRGLFSNEAGEGSTPNAAAIADTSHPVKQGLVQALGVFVDTIVICSCTAFIILLSGQLGSGDDGIILTSRSLESQIGHAGKYFITIAIFLFAFSTVIANYYYGETNVRYLFSRRSASAEKAAVNTFRAISLVMVLLGAFLTLQTAWAFVDLSMGFLTLVNVVALALLSSRGFKLVADYKRQRKAGVKDPVFHKREVFSDEADRLEGWK
ncbi:MAG: alanine:cation symporter family protein [Bacteroidales bacterium]|nr:alanine:cation symporter family protein [Bacteroidales bacterium]